MPANSLRSPKALMAWAVGTSWDRTINSSLLVGSRRRSSKRHRLLDVYSADAHRHHHRQPQQIADRKAEHGAACSGHSNPSDHGLSNRGRTSSADTSLDRTASNPHDDSATTAVASISISQSMPT